MYIIRVVTHTYMSVQQCTPKVVYLMYIQPCIMGPGTVYSTKFVVHKACQISYVLDKQGKVVHNLVMGIHGRVSIRKVPGQTSTE